jgi:hypothetical protein
MLLLCILNLYLGVIARPDSGFVIYMVFGGVYLILVVLMVSKLRFASLLGFLIPLVLLFIYPSLVDFKNLNPWSSGIMGAIDAIIVICCLILLLLKL